MARAFADPRVRGACAAVALVLLVNALIALFPAPHAVAARPPLAPAPPGWVVGAVWTVLFAALGATYGVAVRRNDLAGRQLVVALLLLCAAYPAYTIGLRDAGIGLAGNIITALAALAVGARTARYGTSGAAPFAVVAWLTYATATLLHAPGS